MNSRKYYIMDIKGSKSLNSKLYWQKICYFLSWLFGVINFFKKGDFFWKWEFLKMRGNFTHSHKISKNCYLTKILYYSLCACQSHFFPSPIGIDFDDFHNMTITFQAFITLLIFLKVSLDAFSRDFHMTKYMLILFWDAFLILFIYIKYEASFLH